MRFDYVLCLWRFLLRDKALLILTLLLGAALLIPLFSNSVTFGYSVMRMNMESSLATIKPQVDDGNCDADMLRAYELLMQAKSSKARSTFYGCMADYHELVMSISGQSGDDGLYDEAAYRFCRAMERGGYADYDGSSTMPLAYILPYAFSSMPFMLWLFPAFLLGIKLGETIAARSLFAIAPVGESRRFLSTTFAGTIPLCAMVLVPCIPVAAVGMWRNGIGDAAYPIFYVLGGELFQTTAGAVLVETFGYVLLGNIAVMVIILGLSFFVGRPVLSCAIAVVLSLLPLATGRLGAIPGLDLLLSACPFSYLDFSKVTGYVGIFPTSVQLGEQALELYPTVGLALLFIFVPAAMVCVSRVLRSRERRQLNRNVG